MKKSDRYICQRIDYFKKNKIKIPYYCRGCGENYREEPCEHSIPHKASTDPIHSCSIYYECVHAGMIIKCVKIEKKIQPKIIDNHECTCGIEEGHKGDHECVYCSHKWNDTSEKFIKCKSWHSNDYKTDHKCKLPSGHNGDHICGLIDGKTDSDCNYTWENKKSKIKKVK